MLVEQMCGVIAVTADCLAYSNVCYKDDSAVGDAEHNWEIVSPAPLAKRMVISVVAMRLAGYSKPQCANMLHVISRCLNLPAGGRVY